MVFCCCCFCCCHHIVARCIAHCRRVHISEKTLQCLNGEFEVEPAYGEKREETLRIAGLRTYFIKKVLIPVSSSIFLFFFYTFHYVCMHIASSVRVFYASCKVIEWHCIWCLCILVWTWRQKWRAHRLPRDREWWCVRSIQRGWFKGIFHAALTYHNTI